MNTFDDRETAFESKFAHDADMQFRAEARRNKLLGLWAAEFLGLTGDAAADYAMSVVNADFEEAGIEDVVRKVAADLGNMAHAAGSPCPHQPAECHPIKAELCRPAANLPAPCARPLRHRRSFRI